MKAPILERAPLPQSEDVLNVILADQYPLDPNERLRYLADHYHALPMDMVISDTLMASAQRADQWVERRNVSHGRVSHIAGHVTAINEAFALIGTSEDVSVAKPSHVRSCIRNMSNGRDSFGDDIEGEMGTFRRALSLRRSFAEATISSNTKHAFESIFQAETAQRYIVRELEEHWAGTPTDGFPMSSLSMRASKAAPEKRMGGYWKGRTIGFTEHGVGLVAAGKIMREHTDRAEMLLFQDAIERGIEISSAEVSQLVEQMRAITYLRTSERASDETAIELRRPVMNAFKDLNPQEVQKELEDLWMHNPRLFTPASFRLLGLTSGDADVFSGLVDDNRRIDEAQELLRVEQLHAQYTQLIEDCQDPEMLKFAHEQLSGRVVSMPGVARKYGGGVLRYLQGGFVSRSSQCGELYETITLRCLKQNAENGRLTIKEGQTGTATTASILRRFMLGEIEIVDVDIDVPEAVRNAS